MPMEVPFTVFRVMKKGKSIRRLAMDSYFIEFVSIEPRKAVLIKDPDRERFLNSAQNPLPVLLRENPEDLLKDTFESLEQATGEVLKKRVSHIRRWNILRMIGIPTGHSRHIDIDERLAETERENSLGLALLKGILGVKGSSDLEDIRVVTEGTVYMRLWLEGGTVMKDSGKDQVYTNLLKKDPRFRTAFYSALLRNTFGIK